MKPKNIAGVPKHFKGSFHDTESLKEIHRLEYVDFQFNILKQRLLSINNLRKYCPESTTDFQLFDSFGNKIERFPEMGDYIRIDVPGPGGKEGRSFDWVKITMIDKEENAIMMQCRPSPDPGGEKRGKIAHFYSHCATSTFIVSKKKNILKASIHGRNEYPNFKSGIIDSVRNLIIAIGGMIGFSKIQWKCLTDGLVKF